MKNIKNSNSINNIKKVEKKCLRNTSGINEHE